MLLQIPFSADLITEVKKKLSTVATLFTRVSFDAVSLTLRGVIRPPGSALQILPLDYRYYTSERGDLSFDIILCRMLRNHLGRYIVDPLHKNSIGSQKSILIKTGILM